MTDQIPDYQPLLEAFHRAFASELRAIIRSLPISRHMRVLDLGCGDGFYTRLIAERLEHPGLVVGLDNNRAYIDRARHSMPNSAADSPIEFRVGNLEELGDGAKYDFVWCAQSLYSLPEPVDALAQMAEALRPGGLIAVLENDTLHQLLLPWPTEVEIGLRMAELKSFYEESHQPAKYYVGRRLPVVFAAAGLEPLHFRTQCIDRQAVLDADVVTFLELYLLNLMERTKPHLDRATELAFAAIIDPESERCILRHPHFTMSWLNVLAWGRRPLSR